jgi:hypothetical protein
MVSFILLKQFPVFCSLEHSFAEVIQEQKRSLIAP